MGAAQQRLAMASGKSLRAGLERDFFCLFIKYIREILIHYFYFLFLLVGFDLCILERELAITDS